MFNKIVIIGHLGTAPEEKKTKAGNSICRFTVAVNTGFGENKTTDWYKVSVFGKQAESCLRFLQKGSLVCVTGSIQLREFEAKDGKRRSIMELAADTVTFLTPKNGEPAQRTLNQTSEVYAEDPIGEVQIPF